MTSVVTAQSTQSYARIFPDQRPHASGLYVSQTRTAHLFTELCRAGRDERILTIGSSPHCNLQVHGRHVERVHARIERGRSASYLVDNSPRHTTFADGWQVIKPIPLLVGMVVYIEDALLVATDARGRFTMNAESISDLYRQAARLCGSYRAAAALVGRSHNFIRRQHEPRATRYRKKK